MLELISQLILFYLAITLVLFVPGYAVIYAIWGKKWPFSSLEVFFISFATSIIVTDFIMLAMGKVSIVLNRWSLIFAILLFTGTCFAIHFFRSKRKMVSKKITEHGFVFPTFSKTQFLAILILLFLSFFIKTIYLSGTIMPTSTDLGHHSYWAKSIATTGKIPVYEKIDITEESTLTEPEPIADFIIGEHLIFAAVGLISGISFVSYFPTLLLFLVHIMSILALFALTCLLFRENKNAGNIAIAALFFFGPLYALASPQMKFISGGVIGNTLGNLFIPLAIYFFVRALGEKSAIFFAYALFICLGMAYTHHLSTFVFIFILLFSGLFFFVFNFKKILEHLKLWATLLFHPYSLAILALGALFVFFIYTPTYLNATAVDTAVGTPSKATRVGLTIPELTSTVGEIRLALGLIGIALLFFGKRYTSYAGIFTLGWAISLVAISLKPGWFFIDIPSNRVASYIVFPFSILSGFTLAYFFELLRKSNHYLINPKLLLISFILIFTAAGANGLRDNSLSLSNTRDFGAIIQTYHAANFLAQKTTSEDIILKDHNYLSADSWIKLSFMRGYNYPLSRGYFKRYEDQTKQREQCTNLMISVPNTPEAKQCFAGTGTDFLMVNPKFDSAQFQKTSSFWQVYSTDDMAIFYKNN